jgi:hypothetical protein
MEKTYKYDVFLSFSSQDIDFVKPIWEKLTKSGLKVFFSDEVLKQSIGLDFDDEIENALKQSNHFVLVSTPNAMASGWVKDEYKAFYYHIYKKSRKKRRFIILAGPSFNISLVPLFMRQLQMAKAVDDVVETLDVKFVLKTKKTKKLPPTENEQPLTGKKGNEKSNHKKRNFIKWFLVIIVLAILISSAIFLNILKNDVKVQSTGQRIYVANLSFIDSNTHTIDIKLDCLLHDEILSRVVYEKK